MALSRPPQRNENFDGQTQLTVRQAGCALSPTLAWTSRHINRYPETCEAASYDAVILTETFKGSSQSRAKRRGLDDLRRELNVLFL